MHARNILIRELQQLLLVTKLKTTGPYQLQATVEILHKEYKCQFFVFTNSTLKQKLHFMYPTEYNDELIPIYLHQNYSDENHLIYIKNLTLELIIKFVLNVRSHLEVQHTDIYVKLDLVALYADDFSNHQRLTSMKNSLILSAIN